jgi:trigger factor
VTVHSVKVKELPELDDEFAQSASEYDTLGEFRAGTRARLEAVKRMQQAGQARERALDALLARIDIPLPERLVASEVERREHSLDEQLERVGATRDSYLASRDITPKDLDAEIAADARQSVKTGFVLDQIARSEELGVEQEELNAYIVNQAYRLGVPPDRLAKEIVDRGQLGVAISEVRRSKALDLLAERAAVTDEAGHAVDVKAIAAEAGGDGEAGSGDADEAEDAGQPQAADEAEDPGLPQAAAEAEVTDEAGATDQAEAAATTEATRKKTATRKKAATRKNAAG